MMVKQCCIFAFGTCHNFSTDETHVTNDNALLHVVLGTKRGWLPKALNRILLSDFKILIKGLNKLFRCCISSGELLNHIINVLLLPPCELMLDVFQLVEADQGVIVANQSGL